MVPDPHVPLDGAATSAGGRERFELENHTIEAHRRLRVAVVGAGLSGVIAGVLLPAKVPGIELTIFEKNSDVGGTWLENVYPGVRCDIPSHVYQTSFAPNSQWTEEFARGSENLQYWKDVAARFDVYKYLKFRQKVTRMDWQPGAGKWTVSAVDLDTSSEYWESFDFVVPAIGRFNDYRLPAFPGVADFEGTLCHSSAWDAAFDPAGKRVAVVGNGASGIQLVPTLQRVAARVDHYARSRTWIARSWAGDVRAEDPAPHTAAQLEEWSDPARYLAFRKAYEDKYWRGMAKAFRGGAGNAGVRQDSIEVMRARLAAKPELLERVVPPFSPNCRRPTPGPGYLEALCRENVELIQEPIDRLVATGVVTRDGRLREVDAVVCATGANVDLVPPFPITAGGVDLREAWRPGGRPGWPHTYMGLASPGFPNLLWVYGPQAGGLTGSVPNVVENLVTVIAKVLRKCSAQGVKSIVPSQAAADDFAEYSESFFRDTVLTDQCSSWYNGGKPGGRVHGLWPGSAAHLNMARREPRWEDWEFEYFSRNRFAYLGDGWTDVEKDLEYDITHYLGLPSEVDLQRLHE